MVDPKRKRSHLHTGRMGEWVAVLYFRLRGHRILDRNYRCRPGEIDIVARRGQTLIFVEVKSRTEPVLTCPLTAVGEKKIRRTINAARHFLQARGLTGYRIRFDVITVVFSSGCFPTVTHLPNAFDLDSLKQRWSETDRNPCRGGPASMTTEGS